MEYGGYVYILANSFKHLYTGITSELFLRVKQHKAKKSPNSFTARYGIDCLVYYEAFGRIEEAITRESQIKNMHRIDKVALIVSMNPTWEDLSEPWGKPAPPFDESKMRKPETF